MSNTFISKGRLKLTKSQATTKQHPEAELLLLKIIHFLWGYDVVVITTAQLPSTKPELRFCAG